MGDHLDTWGKWKKDAIRDYENAGTEYLHQRSFSEKYAGELRKAKIMSKLSWYHRWAIKGQALEAKINRHGNAILSEMGSGAAHLAPDSWAGVAFDLGTLFVGGAVSKIAKLAKLGRFTSFGRYGAMVPEGAEVVEALKDIHRAGGFPEIALRTAKLQKARLATQKIIQGAEIAHKTLHVVHAGHSIEKSGEVLGEQFPLGSKIKLPSSNITRRDRPPMLKLNIDRSTLQQPRKSVKHKLPPLKRIEIPQSLQFNKDGTVKGPDLDIFKSKNMEKARKYVPHPRPHKPSVPPAFKHVPSMPTSGVGAGSQPFNWNSNAIPPKNLQNAFKPSQPGQPGWGMEVSRSRPANNPLRNMWQQGNRFSPLMPQPMQKRVSTPSMRTIQSNPLRQMSQGLMNPNRARPMFR